MKWRIVLTDGTGNAHREQNVLHRFELERDVPFLPDVIAWGGRLFVHRAGCGTPDTGPACFAAADCHREEF